MVIGELFFAVPILFRSSEVPGGAQLYAAASLFSHPAVDTEIEGHRSAGFYLPAQLQESAAAFYAGAGSLTAGVVRPGLAAEFILIGQTAVKAVLFVDLVGQPCADADTMAVHAVEAPLLIAAGAAVHGHIVAVLMAVEVFHVAVQRVVAAELHDLARAEMGRDVRGSAVIGNILAVEVAGIVRGHTAAPKASLVVESVVIHLAGHDAEAPVVAVAFAVGAVVQVAVIFSAAVFHDGAEEQLALSVFQFPGKAHTEARAFRIHMGAAFRPQAGAAEGREGRETADARRSAQVIPGGRMALNLLYMIFVSSGMMAFGFSHQRLRARWFLPGLLLINGDARAGMELLSGGGATAAAILFLQTCGWLLGLVYYKTARRVPRDRLGRFVGNSMALATFMMFGLSLIRRFFPEMQWGPQLGSAAAFLAAAGLLLTCRFSAVPLRPLTPNENTVRRLPLMAGVAILLSLAYGINDSTSYMEFEELPDSFGLSRLALGAGLILAGQLADRRRTYLPLTTILASAATMIFHAMVLEGFPAAVLFYANEFFWSFSLLFLTILFMAASLHTRRPALWAGMGRLLMMPSEGLGAAIGTIMMTTLPKSAVLTTYTLTLAAATGLLYRSLISYAEEAREALTLPTLPSGPLRPAMEYASAADGSAMEEPPAAPLSPEPMLEIWRQRYGLTNRESEILRESLSGSTAAEIGKALFISQATVRTHLTHLLKKTGFSTRMEMVHSFEEDLHTNERNN